MPAYGKDHFNYMKLIGTYLPSFPRSISCDNLYSITRNDMRHICKKSERSRRNFFRDLTPGSEGQKKTKTGDKIR